MNASKKKNRPGFIPRRGFTLVELLITISIIALMASMILFAFYAAQDAAKEQKTKALIAKLDAIIKAKYEEYKTRRVPVTTLQDEPSKDLNGDNVIDPSQSFIDLPTLNSVADPGEYFDYNGNGTQDPNEKGEFYDTNGDGTFTFYTSAARARIRLDCLHDLMRMELPDRWSDIEDYPVTPFGAVTLPRPSASKAYLRKYSAGTPPTGEFAGAECLYLIVQSCLAEEGDAKEIFRPDDVKDVDTDGFPEFVDGWGRPIKFLRWAPGMQGSELQILSTVNVTNGTGGTATVTGKSLDANSGLYIGGVIAGVLTATDNQIDTVNMARIIGYTYTAGATPSVVIDYTPTSKSFSGKAYLMAPDPFDPMHAYPTAAAPTPPYALYPLIYSSGPDKVYGINPETSSGTPFQYSLNNLSPFYVPPSPNAMIGVQIDNPNETGFVSKGWLDNIHNHLLGTR